MMEKLRKPLISIVVPVYGVEALLPRCVDSILAQTYDSLQILLVDDGSPDGCPQLCDDYAEKDPRIQVLHKKNAGVSSARNAGLSLAKGTYVTFCDSDDALEPSWIQNLAEAMEEHAADMVAANHKKVYDQGDTVSTCHVPGIFCHDTKEEKLQYLIDYVMTDRHAWEVTTRLFRRSLIEKHEIRFSETCGNFAEDLGFLLEYTLYENKTVSIENSGYLYYMREDSMMHRSEAVARLDSANEVSLQFQKRLQQVLSEEQYKSYGPVFHFLILYNQYSVMIRRDNYHHVDQYLQKINEKEEWKRLTKQIFSCRQLLEVLFGKISAGRILIFSRYLLHRNWFCYKVERFLFFKMNHYKD